jgi:hypothetical protein
MGLSNKRLKLSAPVLSAFAGRPETRSDSILFVDTSILRRSLSVFR